MLGNTANARVIFEEEFKRQIKRTGWRIFTVGVPLVMIIVAFLVPRVIDTLSGDDDGIGSGDQIGYLDNTDLTESLGRIPGVVRIDNLADGTRLLGSEEIKALFVIPDSCRLH